MNDMVYIVGIAVTGGAGAAVALTLNRSLRGLLIELCGTAERAAFWIALARVVLVALPLIVALQFPPDPGDPSAVIAIARQLKWGLVGIVAVAGALGMVLLAFIPFSAPEKGGAAAPTRPGPTVAEKA